MLTPDDMLIGNIAREAELVSEDTLNECRQVVESGEADSLARVLMEKDYISPHGMAKVLGEQRQNPESRRLNTHAMIEDLTIARMAVAEGKISRGNANEVLVEQNERVLKGKTQRFAEIAVEKSLLEPDDLPDLLIRTRRAFILCHDCLTPLDGTAFPPGTKIQCPTCRSGVAIPSEITVKADDFGESLADSLPGEFPKTVEASDINIDDIAEKLTSEADAPQALSESGDGEPGDISEDELEPAPVGEGGGDRGIAALAASDGPGALRRGGRPKTAMIKPQLDILAAAADTDDKAPPRPKKMRGKALGKKTALKKSDSRRPTTPLIRPIADKAPAPSAPGKGIALLWVVIVVVIALGIGTGVGMMLSPGGPAKSAGEEKPGPEVIVQKIKHLEVDVSNAEPYTAVFRTAGGQEYSLPKAVEMPEGTSTITVEAEGKIPGTVRIGIEKDTLKLDFELEDRPEDVGGKVVEAGPASLRVIVQPEGAALTVDNQETQPGSPIEVVEGTHEVSVSAEGYETHSRSIDIGKGEKAVLFIALAAEAAGTIGPEAGSPGTGISFMTNPHGAIVELILDSELERRASPFIRTGLSPDVYNISLRAPGCFERQLRVDVEEGKTAQVLEALPRMLTWSVPVGGGVFSPTITDWNGDGAPEVIAAAATGHAAVLAGVDGRAIATGRTSRVTAPAVAGDVSGDGQGDLVIATYDDAVIAIDGATGKKLWQVDAGGTVTAVPVLLDVDGDGALDAVFVSWSGQLTVVSGFAGKALATAEVGAAVRNAPAVICGRRKSFYVADVRGVVTRFNLLGRKLVQVWERSLAPSNVIPTGIIPADVDGDGEAEIVVSTNHGLVAALGAEDGKALWQADAGAPVIAGPVVGDVAGADGVEVVVAAGFKKIVILSGSSGEELAAGEPVNARITGLALADLTGEGTLTILAAVGGTVSGVAVITEGAELYRMLPTPAEPVGSPAVADINGDGVVDAAVALADGSVALLSINPGEVSWHAAFGAPSGRPRVREAGGKYEAGLLASGGGFVWFDAKSGLPAAILADIPGGPWTAGDLNGDGIDDVFVSSAEGEKAFDGQTGDLIWEHRLESENVTVGPPAFVSTPNGPLVVTGDSKGVIRAFDGGSGELSWSETEATAYMAAPLAADVREDRKPEIICATREHGLVCFDPATGGKLWSTKQKGEPVGAASFFRSGPGSAATLVYATRSRIFVVEADHGEVKKTIAAGKQITSPPALADIDGDGTPEIMYTTAENKLVVRNLDGAEVWSKPVRGFSRRPVQMVELDGKKTILVMGSRGRLDAFDAKGKILWKYGRRSASAYVSPVMTVLEGEGLIIATARGVELLGEGMKNNPARWSINSAQVWK